MKILEKSDSFSFDFNIAFSMTSTPGLAGGAVKRQDVHSSAHLRLFFGSGGSRAASIASSNTFFSPF